LDPIDPELLATIGIDDGGTILPVEAAVDPPTLDPTGPGDGGTVVPVAASIEEPGLGSIGGGDDLGEEDLGDAAVE